MGNGEREPIQSVRAIDRIAFFSDAVFAIAMTLLVLQLRLPSTTTGATLAHDLAELGNQYLSFALSFFGGRTATIFYAASMLVVGATSLINTWYVIHEGLVSERVTPAERATVTWSSVAFIVLFGLSIPVAFLSVGAAQIMWAAVLLTRRVVPVVARRVR